MHSILDNVSMCAMESSLLKKADVELNVAWLFSFYKRMTFHFYKGAQVLNFWFGDQEGTLFVLLAC